jgi:hypothetical protein
MSDMSLRAKTDILAAAVPKEYNIFSWIIE